MIARTECQFGIVWFGINITQTLVSIGYRPKVIDINQTLVHDNPVIFPYKERAVHDKHIFSAAIHVRVLFYINMDVLCDERVLRIKMQVSVSVMRFFIVSKYLLRKQYILNDQ